MQQSKMVFNQEIFWDVDIIAAAKVQNWVKKFPQIFTKEVNEMNKFFPRWVLTVSKGDGSIINCSHCNNTLVPVGGEIACIACRRKIKLKETIHLAWTGHLPTLVSGREKFLKKFKTVQQQDFPLVEVNNNLYLLVPIVIIHPKKWPVEESFCFYTPTFIQFMNRFGGPYIHLLGGARMCLFAFGQWNSITIREVIQQRVVNHLISMIKIADGMSPQEAFIGRSH